MDKLNEGNDTNTMIQEGDGRLSRRALLQAAAAWPLAAGLPPTRAAAAATTRTWRLATGYPADGFHARNIEQFAQDVKTATGGALTIEVHAGGKLAKLPEILAGVKDGRFEAGEILLSASAGSLPMAGVDAIPFVVAGYADAERLADLARPPINDSAKALGLRVLFDVPWPPQGLYSNRPLNGVSDLRGLRIRVYNETTRRFASYVQAEPVEVSAVDLPAALKAGQIDAMITSAVTGVESQAWAGMKHFYDVNAWIPKNAVAVSLAAFDALTPQQQRMVLDSAAQAQRRGWQLSEEAARAAKQTLQSRGMSVEPPGPILTRELKRLGEKFSIEWVRATNGMGNAVFLPYFTQAAKR